MSDHENETFESVDAGAFGALLLVLAAQGHHLQLSLQLSPAEQRTLKQQQLMHWGSSSDRGRALRWPQVPR